MAGQAVLKTVSQDVISETVQPLYIGGTAADGSDAPITVNSDKSLTLPSGQSLNNPNFTGTVSNTNMPLVSSSPIVESGSNTNGYYAKYADGTLICGGIMTKWGSLAGNLNSDTWTFPASFITGQTIYFSSIIMDYGAGTQIVVVNHYNQTNTSINLLYGGSKGNYTYSEHLAFGRWK